MLGSGIARLREMKLYERPQRLRQVNTLRADPPIMPCCHTVGCLNQSAVARWQMAKKGKEKIEGEWKINLGVEKPKKGKELISRIFRAEKTHAKNNLARGNMRFSSLSRAEGT